MKSNIIIVLGLFIVTNVAAQFPAQQHLFRNVPQSQYLNPGAFPEYSGHFGFPALSNIAVTASNSGFSFNDLFVNDSTMSLSKVSANLSDKNYMNLGFGMEVLTFGFKVKKNYFSFNMGPKVDVNFGYSNNLIDFIANGNAANVGETVSFDGTGIDISIYNEFAIGYSREINEKLAIGSRVKFLLGIANVSGDFDGVSLYTDPDNYAITANSSFSINVYGNHLFNDSIAEALDAPTVNGGNLGFGVDFGGSYKLNDDLSLYANVVDLGFLKWSDYGEKWENDGSSFTFDGLDFADFSGGDDTTSTNDPNEEKSNSEQIMDSIADEFALTKSTVSYTTSLKTKLFLGANYRLNKYFDADALLYGRFFNNKFYPSMMLGMGFNVGKAITIKGTYAATNNSYDNVGAGIVLKAGAFQLYGMLDNVLGLTQIDYAKHMSGSFGINFVFTSDEEEKKKEEKEDAKSLLNSSDLSVEDSSVVSLKVDSLISDSLKKPAVLQKDSAVSVVDSSSAIVDSASVISKKQVVEEVTEKVTEKVVEEKVVEEVKEKETEKVVEEQVVEEVKEKVTEKVVEEKVVEEVKEKETESVVEEKVVEEVKEKVTESVVEEKVAEEVKEKVTESVVEEKVAEEVKEKLTESVVEEQVVKEVKEKVTESVVEEQVVENVESQEAIPAVIDQAEMKSEEQDSASTLLDSTNVIQLDSLPSIAPVKEVIVQPTKEQKVSSDTIISPKKLEEVKEEVINVE